MKKMMHANSKRHIKHNKLNTEGRIIKCGLCDKAFTQVFQLKRHLRSHMNIYKCEYCKKSFSYIYQKDEHVKTHHRSVVEDNLFMNDSKCWKNPKDIHKHNLSKRNKISKNDVEEHSGHGFSESGDNCDNSSAFNCEFCNDTFTNSSEYVSHVSSHAVLDNFSCELCGEKFHENSDPDDHLCTQKPIKMEPQDFQYENDEVDNENYTSVLQETEFDSKYDLQELLLNQGHTTDAEQTDTSNLVDSNNMEYNENINKCELCDELFYTLYDYKSHLKTHNVFVDNDHNYTDEEREQNTEHEDIKISLEEECPKTNYELVLVQGTDTYVLTQVQDTNQENVDNIDEMFNEEPECNNYEERHEYNVMPEVSSKMATSMCDICGKNFANIQMLELHMSAQHDTNHKCDICDRNFRRHNDLKRHMAIHTDEQPYSCEICGQDFAQSGNKERHMKIHANEYVVCDLSVCDLCGESFDEIHELKVHIQEHTGEVIKCEFCAKIISNLFDYKSHMQMHILEELFVCNICHKTFSSDDDYNKHMDKHQPTRTILCLVCGKTFRSTHNLKIHMRIHTMSRPYKCDVCGKTFTQTSSHSIHMRIHTGERPYKCEICGKSFSQTGHHKTHMRIHTGLRPFQCELCSKTFSDYGNYIKHTRLHTGDQPYKCIQCNKGFSRKKRYELHMSQHENLNK